MLCFQDYLVAMSLQQEQGEAPGPLSDLELARQLQQEEYQQPQTQQHTTAGQVLQKTISFGDKVPKTLFKTKRFCWSIFDVLKSHLYIPADKGSGCGTARRTETAWKERRLRLLYSLNEHLRLFEISFSYHLSSVPVLKQRTSVPNAKPAFTYSHPLDFAFLLVAHHCLLDQITVAFVFKLWAFCTVPGRN